MNCKQGDIAVIVSTGDAEGIWVKVIEAAMGRPVRVTHLRPPWDEECTAALVWEFEEPIAVHMGGKRYDLCGAGDSILRPLRDSDGEDEMLRIAGKPKQAEDLAVRISTLREWVDEACREVVRP